jgi:hypothetical protein
VIVLGVGLGILASVGALALGSFVIGSFGSIPAQSSAGGIPNAPTGVSFPTATALLVNSTTVPATGNCTSSNLGSVGAPTLLSNGNSTPVCLSTNATGYAFGDTAYTLVIQWSSSAANATEFEVQVSISVTPSGHDITGANGTAYVKTSTHISTSERAVFCLDLTQSSDGAVTSFGVLVTEL